MNHAAFMAAIIEHPDEDAPRLVYADWLDEQGNPLGTFIRVQCELAKPEPECEAPASPGLVPCAEWNKRHPSRNNWCGPCKHRADLRRRESALLAAHGREWLCGEKCHGCNGSEMHNTGKKWCEICHGSGQIGGYPEVVRRFAGKPCERCDGSGRGYHEYVPISSQWDCEDCHGLGRIGVFHRGFPERGECTQDWWMQHGPAIVKAAPCVWVEMIDLPGAYFWALRDLAEPLQDYLASSDGGPFTHRYPTAAAAQEARSRATIRWARKRAAELTPAVARR